MIGKKVADFTAQATDGPFRLADHAGQPVVLYFYPKDNTPGCTTEGAAFRDLHEKFAAAGAVVVGVSRDSVKSHDNFVAKFQFPFALLSDADEALCQAFGVIKEKSLYGRKYMGVERSTFLFDGKGVLRRQWRGVKVKNHAAEVLAAVKAL